jgi:hypothetical protein
MTADEMLRRSTLVFIGVIEEQKFAPEILFHWVPLPGERAANADSWRVLRRRVRIETVLRGVESRKTIDVYEIFGIGPASGDWNSTEEGERDLFLVRLENGRYRLVRDWWRSIFPIATGPHERLPLDDSHSLWERIALLNFWPQNSAWRSRFPPHADPGNALGLWRTIKLERGLTRHPSQEVRAMACGSLMVVVGWGQDECWNELSASDRAAMEELGFHPIARRVPWTAKSTEFWWSSYRSREHRQMLTAINDSRLRPEFCRLWAREYPDDHDNGCPADRPPPATIVTENGDVPLIGAWPR